MVSFGLIMNSFLEIFLEISFLEIWYVRISYGHTKFFFRKIQSELMKITCCKSKIVIIRIIKKAVKMNLKYYFHKPTYIVLIGYLAYSISIVKLKLVSRRYPVSIKLPFAINILIPPSSQAAAPTVGSKDTCV